MCISPSTLLYSSFSSLSSFSLSEVEDVNDNAPLTSDPIYHPVVMENSPKDVSIIRIEAQDPDLTSTPSRLSYRITAGNPQNFFAINPRTGETCSSNTPLADHLHLSAAGGKVFCNSKEEINTVANMILEHASPIRTLLR